MFSNVYLWTKDVERRSDKAMNPPLQQKHDATIGVRTSYSDWTFASKEVGGGSRGPLVEIIKKHKSAIFMMGYSGGLSMMGGAGVFGLLTWVVLLVDFILVGIWLWQQITKK